MNKMRKFLPYILMLVIMVSAFLSPVSFQNNKISYKQALAAIDPNNYTATIGVSSTTNLSASMLVKINSASNGDYQILNDNNAFFVISVVPTINTSNQPTRNFGISPKKIVDVPWYLGGSWTEYLVNNIVGDIPYIYHDESDSAVGDTIDTKSFSVVFADLLPNTEYTASFGIKTQTQFVAITTNKFTTKTNDYSGPVVAGSSITNTEDLLPECGITSIYGCVIQVVYYLFWMPTSFLAALAGKIMDFFIFYSISSSSYNQSTFITEGWKVVRDVANISFIFVLLYIAMKTILNMGSSESKKMIIWVVIIALTINFSLFFTRVIVDSGNILAGVLYNNIGSMAKKDGNNASIAKGASGEEQISVGLVNQFDPQKLIASAGVTTKQQANEIKTPFLIVVLLSVLINLFMIFTFLSVCLLFVGRTVGLMVSMIFSPLAFVSLSIPGAGKILQQFSWSKWFPELVSMAFMAPVFIFFLWLIMLFLDVGLLKGMGDKLAQDGNFLGLMVAVCLPFMIIIAMLTKAKTVAQEMGGEIGTALNGMVGKVVGVAGGLAMGGIAMAGRATIGRGASEGAIGTFRGDLGTGGWRRGERGIEDGKVNIPVVKDIKIPEQKAPVPTGPTAGAKAFLKEERGRVEEEKERTWAANQNIPTKSDAQTIPLKITPVVAMTPEQKNAQSERDAAAARIKGARKGAEDKAEEKGAAGLAPYAGKTAAFWAAKKETPPPKPSTTPAAPAPAVTPPTPTATTATPAPAITTTTPATPATPTTPTPRAREKERMTLKDYASGKGGPVRGILGRQALGALNNLSSNSFDLRNTKLMSFVQKQTGIDFGKAKKGGYAADYKAQKEKELKYAKMLEPTDFEKLELNRLDSLHKDLQAIGKQIDPATGQKRTTHPVTGENLAVLEANALAAHGREETRLKDKTYTRAMSYGQTVDSGTGLNWVASKVLGRNTANNVAIGNEIRKTTTNKSEEKKMMEAFKKAYEAENPPVVPVTPTPPAAPHP